MVLHWVLDFGSVVVVHGKWKLTHLPLLIFWCHRCSSTVIEVLAIDIIEYLHLPSLGSQAHFPMPINRTLRCLWIS